MKKNIVYERLFVLLLTIFVIIFQVSCSTLSSGKKYTLAKVDRNRQLIDPHKVLTDSNKHQDWLDKVNPTNVIGIVLNSGYLPYLQEVGRPEIAIFVTTKIRSKIQPEEELLWERIYLNSEANGTYMAVNKDSFLPRKDIVILPPIIYDGQDILVSIRIIEMDQADNERMKGLVATAATAAATFQPQYAGAISIFQSILNVIITNNADDIEFQYDFTMSQSPGEIYDSDGQSYDMVLNPRIAKYAVIKTEHRKRPVMPFGYADNAQNGLRYGAAEIIKLGTLGILNWPMWCKDKWDWCSAISPDQEDDIYHIIFGRPFAPEKNSFIPPIYDNEHRLISNGDKPGIFKVAGNNLKIKNIESFNKNGQLLDFEDQAFLIFSIVPDVKGVDVSTLQKIAVTERLIENLKIKTSQLAPKELQNHIDPVLQAIEGFVAERNIREQCIANINNSKTEQDVNTVKKECKDKVKAISGDPKSETLKLTKENINKDLEFFAAKRIKQIKEMEIAKQNSESNDLSI